MIHTQYYALLRALSTSIQQAAPNTKINQWDYNYNSKTFDSLKLHRNPLPYPKGVINVSSSQKQYVYPLAQNASVGTNAADLVQFPNAFPIASIENKYEIYGLTNRYNINCDITLHFETNAQLLDFYHAYTEYYPGEGKYFYDFEYDYYLYLPESLLDDYDPTADTAINIFAQAKDDASNYELYAKCVGTPMIKCESITMNQDKNSETHSVTINFNIQDSFIYLIMKVDAKYWLQAKTLTIIIKVEDFDQTEAEVGEIGPFQLADTPYPDWEADASSDQIGNNTDNDTTTNNDTQIEKAE